MKMTIKCKVCGCEWTPVAERRYVARDSGEPGKTQGGKLYDAFDCPACGCQVIAQERKRDYYGLLSSFEVLVTSEILVMGDVDDE